MEVIEVEGAEGLKITIGTPVAASRPWASAVAGLLAKYQNTYSTRLIITRS